MDRERDGHALSEAEGATSSWWSRRGRRLAAWTVAAQLALQAAFALLLVVGERARLGFVALYAPRLPLLVVALLALGLAALARRRLLVGVQLAVCLVVLFPIMGLRVHGDVAAGPGRPIRMTTYNVYFGKLGRPQLLDELVAAQADILVVQAAYDSLGDRLRERFPGHAIHQERELVLVTRFPIVEVDLPGPLAGDLRPMFVTYVLQSPDGPLTVTNVHPFSPRSALFGEDDASADVRRREAQVAAAVAATRRRGPPFVIVGDTNLPDGSAIARRHFAGMEDAFAEVGRGLGYTFPARRPWLRIDRALLGPGARALDARVGPRGASDHRPLSVTFELRRELAGGG